MSAFIDQDRRAVVPAMGRTRALWHRIRNWLPTGGALTESVWTGRHRRLRQLLVVHAFAITAFALFRGFDPAHALLEGLPPAFAAALAGWSRLERTARSLIVSFGLMAASGILIHISGGLIEFHFHIFVMIALVSLYQDWWPFLGSIAFVLLHHGLIGALDPSSVYNHIAAMAHPWRWAAVHAAFVLAMSLASIAAWRLNEFQALYDPLTKLPNRELFRDRVERALNVARRQRTMTGVMLFDLDGFKKVNDSLGHSAGDRLLKEVADRLMTCVRLSDVPARLGGDEFAVLLIDIGGPHDAVRVAERIRDGLRAPFQIDGREILIQASIGIGIADDSNASDITAEQLIRDADVAMYRAKEDADVPYRVFDPVMHASALNRLENEADLRSGLDRNEFLLHYQPIVSLETGVVVGVEALIRWQHPERGLLSPAEIIPLAEDTGMIVQIGQWVLAEACREVGTWATGPRRPVRLSVNLSTRQLRDPDLVPNILSILEDTSFDPECLILEITENATLDDHASGIQQLQALRDVGVRISVDDFGTGYSSLSYLGSLPVDELKIDRSFIVALGRGTPEGSIAEVICRLANAWGLGVVGEGVEEPEELAKLRSLGCVLGQGFYFGRPVPGDQARRAIEAESRFAVDLAAQTTP